MRASSDRPTLAELAGLPPTVSVPYAAKVLGWSRSGTYDAVAAGLLPSVRLSKRVVIPTASLLKLIRYEDFDPAFSRDASTEQDTD